MPASADHFAAYSFVDRILAFEPGRAARARFEVPRHVTRFPSCLVAEAVGQLAAWTAMDHIGFRGRPVAALATETLFLGDARPGDVLDLVVAIDQCDDEAVAYSGRATAAGLPLVELIDCLGPMLPVADFDDPAALRDRLALLRAEGAAPGRFGGVDTPLVAPVEEVSGASLRATLAVPRAAAFFNDHFPRRPVFPATLLLDAEIDATLQLARRASWAAGRQVTPVKVTHVKMRAFMAPGDTLDLTLDVKPPVDGVARGTMQAAIDGRTVASARLVMQVAND